uniref:G-protein coupled receptors family 2 profile 2 domain-containing protein n=1 Tax=Branchiostoma floridae TaxID=7739 RepID=C3YC30_BRAFL|eukprot:XP_002606195.1 hypothetical protein BRAFLDRAFT_92070 [Branchiostoma floridae]
MSLHRYIAGFLCCVLQMSSLVGTNSTQSRSPLRLPDDVDMRQLLILACHMENQETYARLNGKNATKMCYENGTWARKADYNGNCRPLVDSHTAESEEMRQWGRHLENAKLLNNVGHAVSLFCLVIAFVLFGYLKNIRCTRNNIHWNLVATFILRNICWFIMQEVVNVETVLDNSWHCRVAVTLFNYFHVTNFFWMFVEGLYLHMMVAHAFGTERIKCWMYAVIGCIKAVKATVVLLPLLGITYMLFFIHPSGRGTSKIFFRYFNSFLQSFQGCFVSVIYCFSNTEEHTSVRYCHRQIWYIPTTYKAWCKSTYFHSEKGKGRSQECIGLFEHKNMVLHSQVLYLAELFNSFKVLGLCGDAMDRCRKNNPPKSPLNGAPDLVTLEWVVSDSLHVLIPATSL